ncbi:DJ-1/PfpI family protein [Methylocella sp.]|uniref:DJ-1/PfpI family protein n=1 Tax=Methylocella sp. TaxID=1978226 RepID=UPI0037834246
MALTRRDLALAGLISPLIAAASNARANGASDSAPDLPVHDMSGMPPGWMGSEKIAILIYPEFTALDALGPHYMFTNLMGATTMIVAKTHDPVTSDAGLVLTPSASFDECPEDLDILCVPGGSRGTLAAMRDDVTLRFLKSRGGRARYVTSVCTGSLLLGAAGLLDGYRATSHWTARALLPEFGAIPVDARVVRDRNRFTGAGVTAGLDLGLTLVGALRDRAYAEAVQLMAEYAPQPPFDAGTPQTAPPEATALLEGMMTDFLTEATKVGRDAFIRARAL